MKITNLYASKKITKLNNNYYLKEYNQQKGNYKAKIIELFDNNILVKRVEISQKTYNYIERYIHDNFYNVKVDNVYIEKLNNLERIDNLMY